MKSLRSIPSIFAGSILALASTGTSSAPNDKTTSPWTFTKIAPAVVTSGVASPSPAFRALTFHVESSGTGATSVTRMSFMITGTLQAGDLSNFELVYFPGGLQGSAVVLGTNKGSAWAPGAATSVVPIQLATPLALSDKFKGDFALRADLNGRGSFTFSPQLQSVALEVGGTPQLLVQGTCDLPLPGDVFKVN